MLKTGNTRLWRGQYLEDVTQGHETAPEALYLALFESAKGLLETEPQETIQVAKLLLEYDPYNKSYLRLCLEALRLGNNHKTLNRYYSQAKARFTELGETLPDNWQDYLNRQKPANF